MNKESTKGGDHPKKNKEERITHPKKPNIKPLVFKNQWWFTALLLWMTIVGLMVLSERSFYQNNPLNPLCEHQVRCYSHLDNCVWEYYGDSKWRSNGECLEWKTTENE